jgi:signal transduction histidine kinase
LGQKPVRDLGWNLGLRLYLLLVAIFLPTFLTYYVYTIRTTEMLHEAEVEDVIRMTSVRIEDWVATFRSLEHPEEKQPEVMAQELLRIAGKLEALAQAMLKIAKEPDAIDLAQDLLRKAKESDEVLAQELLPLGTTKEPEPMAVELRRIARENEAQAQELQRVAREREALAKELRRIASNVKGIESISVFGVSPEGLPTLVTSVGSSALAKPVEEDAKALSQGRQSKIDVLRGDRQYQSVSVPLLANGDPRGVVHLEVLPTRIGVLLRIREVKANLLLGGTGLVLAVGFGVAIFFHYSVRRPIRQLSETMEDAAEGNLSALVDIRSGEFGWLAATYNRMMRRLKQSVDENRALLEQINAFNVELRGKVEAATAELAAKNAQLEGANERLLTQQKRLTSLEKLATLGEIATIIAHELGTPLNAISGHLQLLLADNVSDPNVLNRLRVIDGQVDRLTGIVRGVLKAMRVPPPRYSPIDVRRVIRDVVDLFSPTAEKRKISVHLRLEESLPPLQADPDQLQQVFMNLFSNAVDAMKEGGVLSVTAKSVPPSEAGELGQGGGCVQVAVSDTGGGMDEETARHAFEPFYTTRNVETDVGASIGMGLGLSICRQIIKNHYGEIAVRSEHGKGTEFTLLIPVNPPALRAAAPAN